MGSREYEYSFNCSNNNLVTIKVDIYPNRCWKFTRVEGSESKSSDKLLWNDKLPDFIIKNSDEHKHISNILTDIYIDGIGGPGGDRQLIYNRECYNSSFCGLFISIDKDLHQNIFYISRTQPTYLDIDIIEIELDEIRDPSIKQEFIKELNSRSKWIAETMKKQRASLTKSYTNELNEYFSEPAISDIVADYLLNIVNDSELININ
jgi:hypothetical protein